MKYAKTCLALILGLSFSFNTVAFGAAKYSDVPVGHWAFESINTIADKGYMVGNISGEYKPDNPIDKFETSKILAMAAGYKYTGVTVEESDYYNKAYEKNKVLLNNYKNSFTKWNSMTDREVAYLLEKQILVEADLAQFVIQNGEKENLRALSRQEAAVFLVKLIEKGAQAQSAAITNLFADDAKITTEYRPYVYYLRTAGVVAGDSTNTFNPNGAVTRAAMAVMLDKTLKLGSNTQTLAGSASANTSANSGVIQIETISGTIEMVHSSLSALQIKYDTGETKIIKVQASANIYVDGFIKTIYDLKENMPIIGILQDGSLVDIKAQAVTQTTGAVSSSSVNTTNKTASVPDLDYRTIQGIITEVKSSAADTQSVTIEVRIINPSGGIIVESKAYTVDSDCSITRNKVEIDFSSVVVNDVVKAKVYNGKAYVLELEEKNRQFTATVTDKKTDNTLGTNYYVVKDASGITHELIVRDQTILTRKGVTGTVKFGDVRIGDTLDLVVEYSNLIEAYAYGSTGYEEGIITEIHITRDGTYIMLLDDSKAAAQYYVIDGAFDTYTLRLNSKVRLRLDSREIEAVSVLLEAEVDYYTGYIDSISTRYITLRSQSAADSTKTKVYYDTNTLVTDSTMGTSVNIGALYTDMKVYVVFTDAANNIASSITILSK